MDWKLPFVLLSLVAVAAGVAVWRRRRASQPSPAPRREVPAYYRTAPASVFPP